MNYTYNIVEVIKVCQQNLTKCLCMDEGKPSHCHESSSWHQCKTVSAKHTIVQKFLCFPSHLNLSLLKKYIQNTKMKSIFQLHFLHNLQFTVIHLLNSSLQFTFLKRNVTEHYIAAYAPQTYFKCMVTEISSAVCSQSSGSQKVLL